MTKLPEGRKPIPNEWFINRANSVIKPMTKEERQRAIEREQSSKAWHKCLSCGGPTTSEFCDFCLKEE